ncbi:Protein unc-80 [Dirofilaria immitis]
MHVRYLQYQHQGYLQRLPMPRSGTIGSIRSCNIRSMDLLSPVNDDDENELESVPLPIQTFLWRQTNPFLGAKMGKLHEASCVTFERVVVQNILHGLSPSLSDAINSVSRWRFVRATFPHIVQCCASLLSEAAGRDGVPMSGSLVKMLYILHWLLLDSANECYDAESRKSLSESTDLPIHSIRQYAFSISSIQLFVYMITPLLNVINEKDLESNFRLESGLKIWQSLWQYRQPEVLCFCAPVKQRRSLFPFITIAKKAQPSSAVQGIYLGDAEETMTRRLSNVPAQIVSLPPYTDVPPPKPPRPYLAVFSSMKKKKSKEEAEIVSPSATLTTGTNWQQQQQQQQQQKQPVKKISSNMEMTRSSSIVRSISDYHESHVPRTFTKSHTTVFDEKSPSLCKGMAEIDNALSFTDDKSLSNAMDDAEVSEEKAPLVMLQEICSGTSANFENISHNNCEIICENCHAIVYHNGRTMNVCKCNHQSAASHFKIIPIIYTTDSDAPFPESKQNIAKSQKEETISMQNDEAIMKRTENPILNKPTRIFDPLENTSEECDNMQQDISQSFVDPQEATYMDVAVIRCLLIKHWAENGVYWAIKYLLHRLYEIKLYRNSSTIIHRSRANSMPNISNLKLFSTKMNNRQILKEIQYYPPTWDDLLLEDDEKKLKKYKDDRSKRKDLSDKKYYSISSDSLLQAVALSRRNDMVISGSSFKSCTNRGNLERRKSDPSATNSSDGLSTRDTRSGSVSVLPKQVTSELNSQQFFPEALGSTNFIEQNGQINFIVLLKAINFAIDRRTSIRIYELALNICENLLEMPETELQSFFNDSINIVLRTHLWLGCPHGCNDGLRSQHGDFLRVKARAILATIFHINSEIFRNLLISHIEKYNAQMLIDTLHSVIGFCRCGIAAGIYRTRSASSPGRRTVRSDSSLPSYTNNFNENLKGIEGTVIKVILKPVVSKLMNTMNELLQPENMSLYQDVRLFVSFIQEQYGSSFRLVGLSALLDGRPPENQSQFLDVGTSQLYSSRRTSLLCPLPEIFLSERNAKFASNDDNEIEIRSDNNSEDESIRSSISGTATTQVHLRESASLRRGLFKKREKVSNTDDSDLDSSPSTPRNVQINDEGTIANLSVSPLLPLNVVKKRSGGKLHFALNLLKSVRLDNNDDTGSDVEINDDDKSQNGIFTHDERRSKALQKPPSLKLFAASQKSTESVDDKQESLHPKRTSLAALNFPSRKFINLRGIQEGVRRFSFFLETCRPGSYPDPPLLGALLDLKSPVLARATLLLECALFVHRCNKGDWPEWIRSNNPCQLSGFIGIRGTPSATRRMHMMQRAAARCFYDWGCQLGQRIYKIMEANGAIPNKVPSKKIDLNRRELIIVDNLEDFFDEGIVNDESGERCPPAILFLACLLLNEITAFLRETFQTIPRFRGNKGVSGGGASNFDKIMLNRRWSILSNTFSSQQHQQTTSSIQSITDINSSVHQGDRRISLSTNEENSSRSSHEHADEFIQPGDKKDTDPNDDKLTRYINAERHISLSDQHLAYKKRPNYERKYGEKHPHVRRSHTLTVPTHSMVITAIISRPARRLAQGRQRLFKYGSPSNASSQPFELNEKLRRSIRNLKSPKNTQFDDEKDGTGEATIPATVLPSVGSGWGEGTRDGLKQSTETVVSPENGSKISITPILSSTQDSISRPTVSSHQQLQTNLDDDEELMFRNFPWLKIVIKMANSFNLSCTHERFCHPWCFERVYRQCYRLTEALRKVYGEDLPPLGHVDKRKVMTDAWINHHENLKKTTQRHSLFVTRRENAATRQSAMPDKPPMALRNLLIEKLNEMEENREGRMGKSNFRDSDDLIEINQLHKRPLPSPMLSYIATQMLCIIHAPLSTLLKSCLILRNEHYRETMNICWHLLVHRDKHIVTSAASLFIVSSVRSPEETVNVIKNSLLNDDPNVRTEGLRRFHALWRNRFHVWLKMEDGAQLVFKVPPPGIDFTLPSPPVGQSHVPMVDPPWMPHTKSKVEELCLKEEEQATSQTIMTMTRTRRKQKQEMVRRATREANERESCLRQKFPFRATAIVQQAAYEPALFHHQTQAMTDNTGEECDVHPSSSRQQMPVAQPLFPSSLLSIVPTIIEMLDDVQLDSSGKSVSDTVKKIVWSCIVEDPALFLRHFLEKLTNRERQEHLISLLRKLILRFQPLPCQTAYTLMNYFFGFVMHYVRSPCEGSDQAIAMALSIIWLIIPHVHGLYFKDLKQTLKKEQCDQALMITANVPSAKKIIIHGPDSSSGGIPSQFPIHEETQFQQLLKDSLEFFNIPESDSPYYFLIDTKTNLVHNPSSYVRDFYFFHRSLYPQLTLIKLNPDVAHLRMRQIAFTHKLIEMGKVLLTHNALAHSPENVIPQRIFFLHDEFTHLPSFPRKSLETCFGMYNGPLGRELYYADSMHKFVWTLLMSDMFEKMENAFMFCDLHLFINVINGVTLLHCENVTILRRCMATYLSMAIHFNTLFTNQGFFLIMPTILRCYSQRQTNPLLCRTIEYVCKQFYILHRKPFLLQMAGSVANILDTNDNNFEVNPMKVKAKYWFNLLHSMEDMADMNDPIDVLGLINEARPLKALDLCYRDDPNTFNLLTDALASAVTVCAFAPESRRCYQMLLVIQATIPYFLEQIEQDTVKQGNSITAIKHEISIYTTLCVEMKALVNCCDILARGPTRTFDIVNSVSDRGKSFIADSPQFFEPPTLIEDEMKMQYSMKDKKNAVNSDGMDNSEGQREIFRRPRDALLLLAATFIEKAKPRLRELTKLASNIEHIKIPELFDHKCYVKLNEIALALLKIAPYDFSTIACLGLQKYFSVILLITDWSVESNRPTLNFVLRRLDKTLQKVGKKIVFRRRTNWTALTNCLNGLYQTLVAYPYIAHSHPLKSITLMCLRIMIGDPSNDDILTQSNPAFSTVLHGICPSQPFCNAALKLASFLVQALGQAAFSLEYLCSSEGIGPTAERLEVVLCHILIPLFLRAALVKNDKPQFQTKDLIFCLNLMQSSINPPLARQSVAPLTGSNLASTLIRGSNVHGSTVIDVTGRQGSVSVTERGHSATVTTHRIVRETVCQAIFLALKVMVIAFEKQMTLLWPRVFKIIRDLLGKKIGGATLYSFIDFMVDINLPISLIILPFLQSKIAQKVLTEQEVTWQAEIKERLKQLGGASGTKIRGYGSLLAELSQELQMMKEDFSLRAFEVARSHTPTITELHSDSGSSQSTVGHRHSNARSSGNDARRLSTTTVMKLNRIASSVHHKEAVPERTIVEGREDDNSHMISSPMTTTNSHYFGSEKRTVVELHDLPLFSKCRKSPNIDKRRSKLETLVLPLNLEEPLVRSSESEKPKVVSFTTPTGHRRESSGDEDFVDRITARHHYV